MSPPSLRVLILGHPLVTLFLMAASGYVAWQCYLEGTYGSLFGVLLCGWVAAQTLKAFDHRRRHRAWRRDCMAIAGVASAQPGAKRPRPLMAVALLAAAWGGAIALRDQPREIAMVALAISGGLGAMLLLFLLGRLAWRYLRRPGRAKPNPPVAIAVSGPFMHVPSLKRAYRSLPPHCQSLLKGVR